MYSLAHSGGQARHERYGGTMRYEMVRLAQLVFALSLMFAAFLGGLAIGWLRWGRGPVDPSEPSARAVPRPEPVMPRMVKRDLFSPQGDGRVIDIAEPFQPAQLGPSGAEGTAGGDR